MATITMHYKTKNDTNGNPRRCYVVYANTSTDVTPKNIVAVYDEGYANYIPVEAHRNVVDSVEVPISTYNRFIKLGKEGKTALWLLDEFSKVS